MTFLEAIMKSAKEIDKQLAQQKKKKWETITSNAAQRFYSGYLPAFYHRRYSLYDVGVAEYTPDGLDVSVGYDPSKMSQYERGGSEDGLYNLVYRGGWHGGAWGANGSDFVGPESVPHYREPVYSWINWGRAAIREDIPPQQYADEQWDEYLNGELTQNISQAVWDAYNDALREVRL